MAKANTAAPTRTAVTERGIALLALIAASTVPAAGVLMLTQDEGAEAVGAGHATVDQSIVEGDTAAVSLTDAGRAALEAASTPAPATGGNTAASATFGIDTEVPMPGAAGTRRNRSGGYPFEALEVGHSFHVAKQDDATLDELLTRLSSSVSGARARFAEEIPGETETVKIRTYKKGDDNKFVKVDGKRVVDTVKDETRPKTKLTRDFFAAKVDANDPKGEGVRIWRVALKG